MGVRLDGKVALVTGSSSGIGAAIATGFAAEGADIIVNYHSNRSGAEKTVEKVRDAGRNAVILRFDVGDDREVVRAFGQIADTYERLDILVNNAGISPKIPFMKYSEQEWDRTFSVNIKSVFSCSREAVPLMKDGGAILNISSIHAIVSTYNFSAYAATKGAMDALTRSLAIELAERAIRVNAIRPGWIDVSQSDAALRSEHAERFRERVPLRRHGETVDIVPTAVLLCSNEASYITGQVWTIDGGHSTMMNSAYPRGHVPSGALSDEQE